MNKGYSNGQGNYNPQTYKKKTGCKRGTDKNGNMVITGWNAASKRRGLIKFIASEKLKDGKVVKKTTSKNGRIWQPMSVKISFTDTLNTKWVNGLYEEASGKLLMNEIDMVANCITNFWGRNFRK